MRDHCPVFGCTDNGESSLSLLPLQDAVVEAVPVKPGFVKAKEVVHYLEANGPADAQLNPELKGIEKREESYLQREHFPKGGIGRERVSRCFEHLQLESFHPRDLGLTTRTYLHLLNLSTMVEEKIRKQLHQEKL